MAASASDIDILLLNVPIFSHRPYIVGIGTLHHFLLEHGVKSVCLDPVTDCFEKRGVEPVGTYLHEIDEGLETPTVASVESHLLSVVDEHRPRMVGFSAIGPNRWACVRFAQAVKRRFPNLKVIVGGPSASYLENDFKKYEFDYLYVGEAEAGFELLFKGTPIDQVPGLVHRRADGSTVRNPVQGMVSLEKRTIPRFDRLFEQKFYSDHYAKYVSAVFSRGCPFKCVFCDGWKVLPGYRAYSRESCLEFLKSYTDDSRFVMIEDSIMNGNEDWMRDLCTGIVESGMNLKWGGVFRIHPRMKDPSYFELVAKSGCIRINFGLESGSANVLKHLKKYPHVDGMHIIFDNLRRLKSKYGFKVAVLVIVGAPVETETDLEDTMKFLYFNRDVIDQIEACTLFNFSPELPLLHEMLRDKKLVYKSGINWATRESTPKIRLARMKRMKEFFERLGLPYNLYDEHLSEIPESELVEWSDEISDRGPLQFSDRTS